MLVLQRFDGCRSIINKKLHTTCIQLPLRLPNFGGL